MDNSGRDKKAEPQPAAWRRYLRFFGEDPHADVKDEIAFHMEGLIEEFRASGMTEDEARRAAHERFGDVDGVAQSMRTLASQREGAVRRTAGMRGLRQDIRYAARSLRRTPLFAGAIIVTLALGLGSASAVFSVLDQLYWRSPAGVAQPHELRRVWTRELQRWDGTRPQRPVLSYPRYSVLAETFGDRARFGLYMNDTVVRLGRAPGGPKVRLTLADRAYFDVLGVRLSHGRLWDEASDHPAAQSQFAVVSTRFADRHMGGGASAVGSRVEAGGRQYTVTGVVAEEFVGLELQATDVWAPLGEYGARRAMPGMATWYDRPVFPGLRAVVRLAGDADARAIEELGTARLRQSEHERTRGQSDTLISMQLGSIIGVRGPGAVAQEVSVAARLGMLAAIMLVIACANVANLLLARAVWRRRELVVRVAVGASRGRLVRLLTVESLLLGLPAGIAAIFAATWAGGLLQSRLLPDVIGMEATLHWRVAAFAMLVAFAASWLTGIVPALQASRADPSEVLKSGGRSATGGNSRVRFMLTTTQIALSVALLAAAGSFLASLRHIRSLDLGLDTGRIVVASVEHDDRSAAPPGEVIADVLDELAATVQAMPGVEAAALSTLRPMSGRWIFMQYFSGTDSLQSASDQSDRWPALFLVSPDYFRTTGMRFVRGGAFGPGAPDGIVVNETMARLLWPDRDALGECMHLERRTSPCLPVTGVVADARRSLIIEEARPQYYAPLALKAADGWNATALVVRVAPEGRDAVIAVLREKLATTFPSAYPDVMPLDETLAPQLRPWKLGAELFTVLGVLGLLLSVIGVYANVAYQVSQRTREFGVRIALGAGTADILGTVARGGMMPVIAGSGAGLLLAAITGRLLGSLLYGTSPHDPVVLAAVVLLLVTVSAVAMVPPAIRARRVEPASVLRSE